MLYNIVFLITLLCISTKATALDFYVTPSGNDQTNGLAAEATTAGTSGPFKTLTRAQQAIRDLKKNGLFKEPITVHIQTGIYVLQKPLEFDIRDSGFAGREIRWQGENGPVVISGGIALQNCGVDNGEIWSCTTSGLPLDKIKYLQGYRKRGDIPGFELFINQQPMHLARWPNTDWAHIKLPIDERTRFSIIEPLPPLANDLNRAQVHIMAGNDWHDQYLGVSAIDQYQNEITLSSNTNYQLASGRRFYLQNIRSELDTPSEWFYDQTNNKILFIPPEKAEPSEIVISALENLLIIKDSNYISFNKVAFRYSTDIAIRLDKTSHLLFNEIEANNIGGWAIEAKNSINTSIINSHIHKTGAGGVFISGGNRNTLEAANNFVHNNHIHEFGRVVMTNTAAIELGGVGSRVTHNLIEQSPGTGIMIYGNDHLLEKNEVHHVCEQASDCGAIYSGRDWTFHGNIIRYNSIHDLFGYGLQSVDITNNKVTYVKPDGVRGVYLDDSVSGFSVIGNLFNNAGALAIQLGSGRFNIIENNLISTANYALFVDHRVPGTEIKKRLTQVPYQSPIWLSKYPKLGQPMHNENWPENNSLQRNIIISNNLTGPSLRYLMPKQSNVLGSNLVWSPSNQFSVEYDILDVSSKRGRTSWREWNNEGIEQDSIYADPCVTITGNQVTFCPDSPAKKIGFQAIPTDIGLIR
ncbi:hypothetical protein [Methylomonas albis]|uniref:Right-handed parallel beta-helix repeat-containing protein n=1 Tax=Methylomonas albis TaxID=1854563 RepID=A0ABR9D5L3_9GAMM|nr:right-handed parallel beta-helix repeat-containing protein [Methylomonas albis]MBD9358407.1 right-handed parallel beta-helix repeat-containing protein [Methylomonas albis]CAD6881809.1 hypothetical protein [Methylomonas albis]